MLASYTWSRSIDDTNYGGAGGGSTPQYAYNFAAEKGPSSFNANQRIVISYLYKCPSAPDHSFAGRGWPSHILGHWQITGIFSAQTGQPFTINDASPQSGTLPSGSADRPDVVGNPMVAGPVAGNPTCVAPTQVGIPSMWFNPCAFLFVKGQFGDEGRNALIGPGYVNWDVSLMKTVTWSEKRRMELRFEAYNIFNHPNFDFPDRLLGDATFGTGSFIEWLWRAAAASDPARGQILLLARWTEKRFEGTIGGLHLETDLPDPARLTLYF